jgi:hypothetical protein
MNTENPLRQQARNQKKDEAKLAIVRDYLENHLSPEDIVAQYRLNN